MQHHFSSRALLLEATVNYINLKRLNTWKSDLLGVPRGAGAIDFIIDAVPPRSIPQHPYSTQTSAPASASRYASAGFQ
jgi:hypothetical protein